MDSGAAESVIPEELCQWITLEDSIGARRGTVYTSASGTQLPNLGQKTLSGLSENYEHMSAVYQVCGVNKPLTSVGRVCDAGNRVIFDPDGGKVINWTTGKETPIRRENGVYYWDLWMETPSDVASLEGFTGPSQ